MAFADNAFCSEVCCAIMSARFCGEEPKAGKASCVIRGECCGATEGFCWKDLPGTERICVGVVEAGVVVAELRRGTALSVDDDGGKGGRAAGFVGGTGRFGMEV